MESFVATGTLEEGSPAARQEVGGPNRILYADDCLNVLRDPLAIPPQSVDLIYLDPPFNSKSKYNLPFKGQYKSAKPVEAFKDAWSWGESEDKALERLREGPRTKEIAALIGVAKAVEGPRVQYRLDAYLTNMAVRLIAMQNALRAWPEKNRLFS